MRVFLKYTFPIGERGCRWFCACVNVMMDRISLISSHVGGGWRNQTRLTQPLEFPHIDFSPFILTSSLPSHGLAGDAHGIMTSFVFPNPD